VIERASLERVAVAVPPLPHPWPPGAKELLVRLLQLGPPAVHVIEALDQRGAWVRTLPEWAAVRSRPQRNPYHRYTVDRHLLEATSHAARLAHRVQRPDLLVVAALLHDIGKGQGGDHSAVGTVLARDVATRMGFEAADVATIVALVEHHLLLADVATRRDLDDPATVERVAALIGTVERLQLLACLTEADGRATGPAAWGPWKAELVSQLVTGVTRAIEGGSPPAVTTDTFPGAQLLARLRRGDDAIEVDGDTLIVMTADRPGVFSRVAGVLALHGLDVLHAAAYSTDEGRALSQFRVSQDAGRPPPWERVTRDLTLALEGRLALGARVAARARTYQRPALHRSPGERTRVSFDIAASADATVIDVQTDDGVGVLFRITRTLAELDVDIRSARVQTLGTSVVDAFYVKHRTGAKISDPDVLAELERAILHSLDDG
jgi:[protein-PII] uridylyltransferase